jgi:uncharacterized protein (TIGR00369 family)
MPCESGPFTSKKIIYFILLPEKIYIMEILDLLQLLNQVRKDTLLETLDIRFTDAGEDYLVAEMPVNSKVHQPAGLLHGGATIALAESVGSAASALIVSPDDFHIMGISVSANHVKSIRNGKVTARAEILHRGKTTHLWEVRITDEQGKLISICKITNIILPK